MISLHREKEGKNIIQVEYSNIPSSINELFGPFAFHFIEIDFVLLFAHLIAEL